jgi:hypothetical protein
MASMACCHVDIKRTNTTSFFDYGILPQTSIVPIFIIPECLSKLGLEGLKRPSGRESMSERGQSEGCRRGKN